MSSCKKGISPKEAWQGVIQPCIITRWSPKRAEAYGARSAGRALIISTPKGYNFFHELFTYEERDDRWKSYHYTYRDSPFLDQSEIELLRDNLDPIEFASEYKASFEDSGNSVFYMFNRKVHVRNDLPYFYPPEDDQPGEDVYLAIDFNVGLQCTSACAIRGGQVHILDEFKGHPDTEQLAIAVQAKYKGHTVYGFPDPSGRARKTSAPVGRTDFSILESYGIKCIARAKAPPIIDSVSAVNKKLMTASGKVDLYVSTKCPGVITSLERTKWVDKNPDTATIDKSGNIEHYSDGIRYLIEYLFPIRNGKKKTSRGFGF